jgi:hypothetical protein
VGRKSSGQDKGEGAMDKVKGRAKEAAGAVTSERPRSPKDARTRRRALPRRRRARLRTS